MTLLDKGGKPLPPSDYAEFKDVLDGLIDGTRVPVDDREVLLQETIASAQGIQEQIASPVEAVLVAWWTWISVAQWVSQTLTGEGRKVLDNMMSIQTQLATQIVYDAWKNTEGISASEDAESVGSEAPLSIVP